MTKPKARQSLSEQCALVVELSGLQKQLREAVVSRQQREKLTVGSLASRLGLGWNEVESFVNGRRAVCRGAILSGFIGYVENQKLASKIGHLAEKLGNSSRVLGLSVQSKETIELVYALLQKYEETEGLGSDDFAEAFDELKDVVESVLQWRSEGIARLEAEAVYAQIMDRLTDRHFEERLEALRQRRVDRLKAAASEMEEALEAVRPRYASLEDMCRALQVDPSTVYRIRNHDPRSAVETVRRITEAARKLGGPIGEKPKPAPPPPSGEPQPPPPVSVKSERSEPSAGSPSDRRPKPIKVSPTRAMLRDHAGGTSEDGIRFVLTSETFQELDFHPGPRGIRFARSQLALARALLNMFCQIKNPEIRETVRQAMSGEVEELEYAIRLFSQEFPNNLLPLHDAARTTMGRMRLDADGKGKGAKK